MCYRYAVYYAPGRDTVLDRLGAAWLGRDATSGEPVAQPDVVGIEDFTAEPRRYGLHATLKPPMQLAEGRSEAQLREALAGFAAAEPALALGGLQLADIAGFLALVPRTEPPALADLAARIVATFEPFRAPLTPEERSRRLRGLTEIRHVELVDRFGYPWVMDAFRFHITLTGRLPTAAMAPVRAAAERHFARVLAEPAAIDRLCLFAEPAPGSPFRRLGDFPFKAAA